MTARLPTLGALALLLALLTCGWVTGVGTVIEAQTDVTPTPHLVSTIILGVFSDYSIRPITETPTPFPTWTAVPSVTPFPSLTPSDTPTPTPTRTPDVTVEPTQEDVRTPSPTPIPTNTPTPSPTPLPRCWGTVTATRLNVRDVPWGSILGQVTYGQTLYFDAQWYQDFWWWRIEFWEATGDDTFIGAYVSAQWIAMGDTADCSQLVDVTPPPIAKSDLVVGWFSMPNGNVWEQVEAHQVGMVRGIRGGTHPYANPSTCIQVMEAGGWCVYRHGNPDCPSVFEGDPRASARAFMIHDQYYAEGVFQNYPGQIWIDPLNECEWGVTIDQLDWWKQWFSEYITQAKARNWPPLVLPSMGPGYGDKAMFQAWASELRTLDANGGMLAMHVYNPVSTWLCPFDQWLADRTLHNHEILEALDIDIRIAVTEVGAGWGNEYPNIPDMACWIERTAQYPFVAFIAIWEMGVNHTWIRANWEGHSVDLIRALDATLWG
jgi:hypothetical protein